MNFNLKRAYKDLRSDIRELHASLLTDSLIKVSQVAPYASSMEWTRVPLCKMESQWSNGIEVPLPLTSVVR